MPENTPGFTPTAVAIPPYSLVGGPENIKLLFDEELDDRRSWRSLQLRIAEHNSTVNNLIATNAAVFSHAVNMGSLLSAQAGVTQQQTGVTDNQQSVSPIRTGAADSQNQQPAGAVYPPIRNVDQSAATANGVVQTALAGISAAIAEQSNVVAKLADAVNALLAKSAGQSAGTVTPQVPTA